MQNRDEEISFFVVFCVEAYKNAHLMSGEEVVRLFSKNDIFSYLDENYEVLHTQSRQWIIEEIDELIYKNTQSL